MKKLGFMSSGMPTGPMRRSARLQGRAPGPGSGTGPPPTRSGPSTGPPQPGVGPMRPAGMSSFPIIHFRTFILLSFLHYGHNPPSTGSRSGTGGPPRPGPVLGGRQRQGTGLPSSGIRPLASPGPAPPRPGPAPPCPGLAPPRPGPAPPRPGPAPGASQTATPGPACPGMKQGTGTYP